MRQLFYKKIYIRLTIMQVFLLTCIVSHRA